MAHLPATPDHSNVLLVLREMRRVTKPGGFVVSRDVAAQHFFPTSDLDGLIMATLRRATGLTGWYGDLMPRLYNTVGFDTLANNFEVISTVDMHGPAVRESGWAVDYAVEFARGTRRRAQWIAAGISDSTLDSISMRLMRWGRSAYSWYACLYTEVVAEVEV
ncbi:hypothetical protein F5B18DRAFT_594707 [Nemania serpens]|nr:hypothetical protein F5B18DRAFT_594707 [Nemania serpens]